MRLHALAILAAPEAQDRPRYMAAPRGDLAGGGFADRAFDINKQGQVIGTRTELIRGVWVKGK